MKLKIYQVDAFSRKAFRGNPAGVCPLKKPLPEAIMQAIAAEMNLSETAFFWPCEEGFRIRYFTPIVEVPLCGHATLTSAHVLWESGQVPLASAIEFNTRRERLTIRSSKDWIVMNFPQFQLEPYPVSPALEAALGIKVKEVYRILDEAAGYLVEVKDQSVVESVNPDVQRLLQDGFGEVIVTSPSSNVAWDFVSRFFAPGCGIDEDPVTGYTHCCLGPYWSRKLGKSELVAFQLSKRGGLVKIKMLPPARLELSGQAITVLEGWLRI
jgi:PhzF family phenazine biosynthesis protein